MNIILNKRAPNIASFKSKLKRTLFLNKTHTMIILSLNLGGCPINKSIQIICAIWFPPFSCVSIWDILKQTKILFGTILYGDWIPPPTTKSNFNSCTLTLHFWYLNYFNFFTLLPPFNAFILFTCTLTTNICSLHGWNKIRNAIIFWHFATENRDCSKIKSAGLLSNCQSTPISSFAISYLIPNNFWNF